MPKFFLIDFEGNVLEHDMKDLMDYLQFMDTALQEAMDYCKCIAIVNYPKLLHLEFCGAPRQLRARFWNNGFLNGIWDRQYYTLNSAPVFYTTENVMVTATIYIG